MTPEQIKKESLYKLANRLFVLGTYKQTKRVIDEYNLIVEEMWSKCELLKGDRGVKKMERKKKKNAR